MSKKKQKPKKSGVKPKISVPSGFAAFKQAQQNRGFSQFKPNSSGSSVTKPIFGKRGDR